MSDLVVASVVGNPRPGSRTHAIGRTLAGAISAELGTEPGPEIDLATLGARTLDPADPGAIGAVEEVLEADVLVVASPTYHFTPLLLELGAAVPVRGLFVVEAELEQFPATARAWAHRHAAELVPAFGTSRPLEASNQ